MKRENIEIKVITFYDSITPESAKNGDYESTGNDYREFRLYSLKDAVDQFISDYEKNYWDISRLDVEVNQVLCAADPTIDYKNGVEDYDCLILSVTSNSTAPFKSDRQKRIERALNYLIQKRLGAL